MRHNSKKQTWFCRSSINKDTIMRPHQVENESPSTQHFSIKTLIGPHCQVGVRGESGHQMNCLLPVPVQSYLLYMLLYTHVCPSTPQLSLQTCAGPSCATRSWSHSSGHLIWVQLLISCVAPLSSDNLNCTRRDYKLDKFKSLFESNFCFWTLLCLVLLKD